MPIERLNPDTMGRLPGAHQTVKTGNTVYIAGQVARDAQENIVGKGDAAAQLEQVYKNMEAACKAHGGSLASIVKTTTYVTDLDYFPAVRDARMRIYGDSPPTSTTVVVKSLANPDFLVEIEAIAYIE